MSDTDEPQQRGLPIYRDSIDRGLPDPTDERVTDWYPATSPTSRLWRCYEAMQKLTASLQAADASSTTPKQRRFLIQFAVPLLDFFACVNDLTNAIEADPQTRSRLSEAELQYVRTLRTHFREEVSDHVLPLRAVRDKLGAHTDKTIDPSEAARLVEALDLNMIAAWLHAALLVLDKLSKLDCYAWTSAGDREGYTRLMTCEPFVISYNIEDPSEFFGMEMTESPKRHLHERIADIVELSTWMFAEGQTRLIVSRHGDPSRPVPQ